ncbi:MAG: TonB-dependent receptor [Pseudomonadota bacterium]
MKSLFLTSAAAFTLLPMTSFAQESVNDAQAENDIITVQASRRDTPVEALPTTVRLISAEEVSSQLLVSNSLLDVIGTKVPSTAPSRQKLSGLGESFRGREPLYLIDGVPQSNPLRNGSRDGFTIDPAVIERIEILYGANAIQGVGATGGVINYVTLSPTTSDRWETRLEGGVTAGDDRLSGDTVGYRGGITALRDFGAIDVVASIVGESRGAFYDADGQRIGVDNTQGDIQDSSSLNAFAKIGWDIDDLTRLQFTANIFELEGDGDYIQVVGDRDAGIPATSIRGEFEGEPATNSVQTFSFDFTRDELFGGDLGLQAFYQDFESIFGGGIFGTFQDSAIDPSGELFDQSANNSEKYGVKLTYSHSDLGIEGLTVTGGVDFLRDLTFQELIQTGRNWVPETEFISYAPFLQLDQALFEGRVNISGGVRNEFASLSVDDFRTLASAGAPLVAGGEPDFSELLVNIGGTFEVVDGITAYAAFSEGFTMPDVGRVLRGINTEGQDVDDLLNIEPIVADNTEVGLTFAKERFEANVSYFWSTSELGQRLVDNGDGFFEVRREETEIEGLEISAEYDVTDRVTVGTGYAAIEGSFDSDGDGAVDSDIAGVNISPDRLNLFIAAQPTERWNLRLQTATFFDREFDDEGDATDFDGYTLVEAFTGVDLGEGRGRLDLGVQNLLNEDYITYYSQSGTTRENRFFAGRGRTITLRWSASY